MIDIEAIETERSRMVYLLVIATSKAVRKTLRSCIHLLDSLLAQLRGSDLYEPQVVTDTDRCPGRLAIGSTAYMPPCVGCGKLTTARGTATMRPPGMGIKAHRLHCPERRSGAKEAA